MVGRDPGEGSYPSGHEPLGVSDDSLESTMRILRPYRNVMGAALVVLMLLYMAVSLAAYL